MALSNPIDIQRHRQFRKDVNDLSKNGYLRHYSADINRKTGESTGNISNYFKGKVPIGDNFLKKFNKAYGRILKEIREPRTDKDLPLASNDETPSLPAGLAHLPPNTTPSATVVRSEHHSSDFQFITEKLADIKASLDRLEQKIDQQAPGGKKRK